MRNLAAVVCVMLIVLGAARPAEAQVDWTLQGGARYWTNVDAFPFATAGADVSFANGVFVGVDTTFRDGVFAMVGQGGYQTRRPAGQGVQGYVLAAFGAGTNPRSNAWLSGVGGGVRLWLNARVAPFIDVREQFASDPDWDSPVHQLSFGVTFRIGD